MRRILSMVVLLAGATYSVAQAGPVNHTGGLIEAAVTYTPAYAKVSNTSCNCFWFQGGTVDVAIPLRGSLSVDFNVTGEHTTGLSGISMDKVDYLIGPRWSFDLFKKRESRHRSELFAEALAGAVRGFNGIFPESGSSTTSASSYAVQLGGGHDLALRSGVGLRLAEADYVRSGLPNNGSDTQNDLRLATGVYFRFGRR
jgi:hypothetical protein